MNLAPRIATLENRIRDVEALIGKPVVRRSNAARWEYTIYGKLKEQLERNGKAKIDVYKPDRDEDGPKGGLGTDTNIDYDIVDVGLMCEDDSPLEAGQLVMAHWSRGAWVLDPNFCKEESSSSSSDTSSDSSTDSSTDSTSTESTSTTTISSESTETETYTYTSVSEESSSSSTSSSSSEDCCTSISCAMFDGCACKPECVDLKFGDNGEGGVFKMCWSDLSGAYEYNKAASPCPDIGGAPWRVVGTLNCDGSFLFRGEIFFANTWIPGGAYGSSGNLDLDDCGPPARLTMIGTTTSPRECFTGNLYRVSAQGSCEDGNI